MLAKRLATLDNLSQGRIWTDDIVEFKGKYYDIPASKIYPKPFQKPHIPIYLGGFSSNIFSRIVKQDLNGWLGVIHGPLAQLQDSKNAIKQYADQMNKDSKFQTIVLSYPNIENDSPTNDRFPLTGTIDEVGRDIQRIKDMGVDHIVFGYNFVPTGRDMDKMISLSKELSKFAR